MKRENNPIVKLFNVVYRILLEYSKWVLLVIIFIVSADVFSRNVLGSSVRWGQEVSLLLIVWMTFLSMTVGVEKDTHIAIELFFSWFPKPMQKFLNVLNNLVLVAVGCFLTYYGFLLVKSTWTSTLPITKWPAGMLYLMIPVGGATMTFFKILDLFGLKPYKNTHQYEDEENGLDIDASSGV